MRQPVKLSDRFASPLSECLGSADSPAGRARVAEYLASQPYPHYEAAPDARELLVRIDADGKRTVGRFVDGRFEAVGNNRAKH